MDAQKTCVEKRLEYMVKIVDAIVIMIRWTYMIIQELRESSL